MEVLFIILFVALVGLACVDEACTKDSYSSQLQDMNFLHTMNEHNRIHQELMDQHFNQWAMEESIKSVTPFEMGGYDMSFGNSFNDFDCGGGFSGFDF